MCTKIDATGNYVCDSQNVGACVPLYKQGNNVVPYTEGPFQELAKFTYNKEDLAVLEDVGLSVEQVEEMYRYLAIANYEDRFVIPTAHREQALKYAQAEAHGCGFSFGNGCSDGNSDTNIFGAKKSNRKDIIDSVQIWEQES